MLVTRPVVQHLTGLGGAMSRFRLGARADSDPGDGGRQEDEEVRHYRFLLRTAPAEALEAAHAKALAQLSATARSDLPTPANRGMVGRSPAARQVRALRGSADALGQRDDDSFRPPDIGHPPSALVLSDATDQSVAFGRCPIDSRLQVVDLEGHVA